MNNLNEEELSEIITEKEKLTKELQGLAIPLQIWLRKNYDLMCSIVVDGYSAKVVRTEMNTVEDDGELIC